MLKQAFALILLAALTAGAQGTRVTRPGELPSRAAGGRLPADDAMSISLAAHGRDALLQIVAIRLRGTSTGRSGAAQPVTVSSSLESTRIDYGAPITRSLVTTPHGGFELRNGERKIRPAHSGLYSQRDIFGVLALRPALSSGKDRGVLGNGEVSGRSTMRIRAGSDNQKTFYGRVIGDEFDVEFDHQTGLVAAIHRGGSADENLDRKFVLTYAFSDYRKLPAELWLPYRITVHLDGQLVETLAVETYELNPAFDADLFRR